MRKQCQERKYECSIIYKRLLKGLYCLPGEKELVQFIVCNIDWIAWKNSKCHLVKKLEAISKNVRECSADYNLIWSCFKCRELEGQNLFFFISSLSFSFSSMKMYAFWFVFCVINMTKNHMELILIPIKVT